MEDFVVGDGFGTAAAESVTVAPPFILRKDRVARSLVGVTCVLSIIGSLVIIFSYLFFRDLRTNARLILVHLSVSDLGVSLANLSGELTRFGRHFNHTILDYNTDLSPPVFNHLCKIQAFIAHYFTISSVLWTLILSTYMYAVTTKLGRLSKKENRLFNLCACVICYGMALINSVWLEFTNRLGYSPRTSGWCGTIVRDVYLGTVDYVAAVLGYDIWIVLTSFFIIVTYLSLLLHIRQEKKRHPDFKELSRSIDYKFILIPVAFVVLRIWSFIHNVIMESGQHVLHDKVVWHKFFIYLSGVGDSGQGTANAILFVIFTHNVRQRYIKLFCRCFFCRCFFRKPKEDKRRCLIVNHEKSSSDSSISHKASSPFNPSGAMYIKKSIPQTQKKIPMVAKSCDTSTTYGSIPSSSSS